MILTATSIPERNKRGHIRIHCKRISSRKILHSRNVQYLVVGGTAIAFYGFVRPTTSRDGTVLNEDDFDFWFNPTYPNYLRLLDAFDDMQLDTSRFREEEHPKVKRFFFSIQTRRVFTIFFTQRGRQPDLPGLPFKALPGCNW